MEGLYYGKSLIKSLYFNPELYNRIYERNGNTFYFLITMKELRSTILLTLSRDLPSPTTLRTRTNDRDLYRVVASGDGHPSRVIKPPLHVSSWALGVTCLESPTPTKYITVSDISVGPNNYPVTPEPLPRSRGRCHFSGRD